MRKYTGGVNPQSAACGSGHSSRSTGKSTEFLVVLTFYTEMRIKQERNRYPKTS